MEALSFIIVISNFVTLQEIPEQMEQITEYLFFKTTVDDIVLVTIGLAFALFRKWGRDNAKFERKVSDAKIMTAKDFKEKHGKPAQPYKNMKWSWKIWWKENDQKIIPAIVFSYVAIIGLPYGWVEYMPMMFESLEGTQYNPLISLLLGGGSFFLMKAIEKKEREYLN